MIDVQPHAADVLDADPKMPIAWRHLVNVVPTGLGLVSAKNIASQIFELMGNATSRRLASIALANVARALDASPTDVALRSRDQVPDLLRFEVLPAAMQVQIARGALDVYFTQLFGCDVAFLDLGLPSFRSDGQSIVWTPRALFVHWDPEFLDSIRHVYRGFFRENPAMFDSGLARLELAESAPIIREHLGDALVHPTRFGPDDLDNTLSKLVAIRPDRSHRLHRNFVALGLLLTSLHLLLARVDQPLDLHEVFSRVVPK